MKLCLLRVSDLFVVSLFNYSTTCKRSKMLKDYSIALTVGAICLFYLGRFFYRLHWNRSLFKGLPGPPHSYIWGSLPAVAEVLKDQPKRAAPQGLPILLKEKYNLGDYFYFDPWPFGPISLVILNTDMMQEFTVKRSLPKHPNTEEFVRHIGGPGNLVSSEGAEWKKWRAAFNPGFSSAHLMTLVPIIVEQGNIFVDILTQKANNKKLFRLEPLTTRLTVDVIGKVVLDVEFGSQHGPNELVDALLNQIIWQPVNAQFSLLTFVDFRRWIKMAYNTWKMNRHIGRLLDARFATRSQRGKTKCIVDLALEAYLKENKGANENTEAKATKLDPDFKTAAISNMKVFLFGGHDTTSSTISYSIYYLSKHPDCLARVMKEHTDVLGSNGSPKAVGEALNENPYLLNKLEYTLAVIREVLRLQPPVSTIRIGQKGFYLRDPETGDPLPTDNFMLWPVDTGIGRSAKYWSDPHTFNPDRFLSSSYPKDAWIPFSKGIRNCIGQDLAIMEVKIILAMTMRHFEFQVSYQEVETLKGDGSGYPSENHGIQTQFGEEGYQIQIGAAKPREGLPCRVSLRG
jgi:cytochrome P450